RMDSLSDLDGDNNHHEHGRYCSQRQNRSGDNPAHSKNQKPALFRAISQDSTKSCSKQRADSSSATWSSPPRLRRTLSMALNFLKKRTVFADLPRQSFG